MGGACGWGLVCLCACDIFVCIKTSQREHQIKHRIHPRVSITNSTAAKSAGGARPAAAIKRLSSTQYGFEVRGEAEIHVG